MYLMVVIWQKDQILNGTRRKTGRIRKSMAFHSQWLSWPFWMRNVSFSKTSAIVRVKQDTIVWAMLPGGIMTVRFTYRNNKIRIIGAGYWRKGKKLYEEENQIYE